MAASIGTKKLLENIECLVIFTLCHFLSFLSAEKDVSESMLALSNYENSVLCCCHFNQSINQSMTNGSNIRISTLQRDLRQSKLDLACKLRSISDSDKISSIVINNFLIRQTGQWKSSIRRLRKTGHIKL